LYIEVRKGNRIIKELMQKVQQIGSSLFALYEGKKYLIEFDEKRRGIAFIDLRKRSIK
jgi:hypothetical protein